MDLFSIIIAACAFVVGVAGGWVAHPVGASLVTRRRVDELDQLMSDLASRFAAWQKREYMQRARAEKELGGDITAQAAAILTANARRGNGPEPGLRLKDHLRRRANLLGKED